MEYNGKNMANESEIEVEVLPDDYIQSDINFKVIIIGDSCKLYS